MNEIEKHHGVSGVSCSPIDSPGIDLSAWIEKNRELIKE